VAAFAEMVGHDLSISRRRIDQMVASVETVYPGMCEFAELRPWAGLRPATPDSLPMIGQSKIPGLFINSGHGALGFTLAAGSAVELCRKLATALPPKAASSSRQKFVPIG
jgi:D-amino-acid dehydrogenase